MNRFSLFFMKPYHVRVKKESLKTPDKDQVLVKTLFSSISAGTEMLIYRNKLKKGTLLDTTIPALSQRFSYPCKYGYSSVGKVIVLGRNVPSQGRERLVFAFHPHESHFTASPEEFIPIPSDISLKDALFLPNMETALNFVLDGGPIKGKKVVVFGQGVVGLLLTALLAQKQCSKLITVDNFSLRRAMSKRLGADISLDSHIDIQKCLGKNRFDDGGVSLCFEVSGEPSALNTAIQVTGFGGKIVVGSWYGTKKTQLDLGDHFHRNRIHIQSSQVSTIDSRFSVRWTKERGIATAFETIRKIKPAHFVTHVYPFYQAAEAYELLDTHPEKAVQVLFQYEEDFKNV